MGECKEIVNELVRLFDDVLAESPSDFGVDHWHSLEWNLHNVTPAEWDQPPTGGERTIRELAIHVGHTFVMYEDATFGNGSRDWDDDTIDGKGPGQAKDEVIAWVRSGHARLRASIAALTDGDLTIKRPSPWGYPVETRRIIEVMLQHTTYHTGEINHLRALLQRNDTWGLDDIGREE